MRRRLPLTAAAALTVLAGLGLLAPAAQALPRGFFGIVPQTPIGREDTARMRQGGVETIRAMFSWGGVQPRPNAKFDWGGTDALVATAARDRIEIFPYLISPPRWASKDPKRLPIDNARQRRGWAQFVRAAVERYGTRGEFWREHGPGSDEPLPRVPIRHWQIWNEENFFYFTRPASPGRYARLLAISHRAIQRADPRAEVVLGGLFGNPRQGPPLAMDAADFLDRLYSVRGVKASFDGIALHPYAADTAELRGLVEAVRRVAVAHGDRRAGLYLTEVGWGSKRNPRAVAFEVGRREQARELRRSYDFLIANRGRLNVEQVHWFTWKDLAGSCSFCDSTGLFHAGERFKPKPAWNAFRSVARRR